MSRRTRNKGNLETVVEEPTLEEALNYNIETTVYDKFSEIVRQYGNNILLRVFAIKSDNRSLGFIDEVVGDEIDLFLQNPEMFLKDRFGHGVFRVIVVNNSTKKFISNLTISVSNLKNPSNPTLNIDVIGEVSKARKEGRQEFVELASFIKSSQPPPSNQPAFDMVEFFKLMLATQDKTREEEERMREREDKRLEEIKKAEIRLREKELEMIEKAYANNADVTAHMKPFLDSMGVYGKMLSNSIGMVERALDFKEGFNTESSERSFIERVLIGLGEKFINSNPQIFDKLTAMIPQMNIPRVSNTTIGGLSMPNPTPIDTNPPTQTETKTNSFPTPENPNQTITVEQIFLTSLLQMIDKGSVLDDPESCAYDVSSNFEYFEARGIMTRAQIKQFEDYLTSESFIPHLESINPNFAPFQPFLIQFQKEYKKLLTGPDEETKTQRTN